MYDLAEFQQKIAEERVSFCSRCFCNDLCLRGVCVLCEQSRKERELEEKKKEVKNAKRMEEWRKQRESAHKEIAAEVRRCDR